MDFENNILLEKIEMECPICGLVHLVEKRTRISKCLVKDEPVEYNEVYFVCTNAIEVNNDYCEFAPAGILGENILRAKNKYRTQHGLLTSEQIISIRNKYDLTQSDLALILGWGEVTVARFETKSIQTQEYDNTLKHAQVDPSWLLDCLVQNKAKFTADRFERIKCAIQKHVNQTTQMRDSVYTSPSISIVSIKDCFYDLDFSALDRIELKNCTSDYRISRNGEELTGVAEAPVLPIAA